ncbi:MAG: formylglycine-generating enzyme family protein [Chroococcidiopsidaceae cyanobacterium CP_BM_RX_35]|nr:formylglycine-generating enzyme family protein [Chroococcidiopsidaceae cyanobacterium CP_BM_RX_35]
MSQSFRSVLTRSDRKIRFPGRPPAKDMVWIPGGTFLMGSDRHYPEEAPAHKVEVNSFWMDRFLVTNAQFQKFVKETRYVTFAERPANPDNYPGAKPELLQPSSTVFFRPNQPVDKDNHYNWWSYIPGANWRHPEGPGSSIKGREKHPVVHVAYEDVEAYAKWIGKELPTEAEWEFAARGGLDGAAFSWGDELHPKGKMMANTWQGEFPVENLCSDGYDRTSPIGVFPLNGYGLYDMIGNVWEWTADWYQDHRQIKKSPCCTLVNPRGAAEDDSYDFQMPDIKIPRKVTKGGSFLCAPSYCQRYRPAARMAQPIDTSTCHLGFRLIVRESESQ